MWGNSRGEEKGCGEGDNGRMERLCSDGDDKDFEIVYRTARRKIMGRREGRMKK